MAWLIVVLIIALAGVALWLWRINSGSGIRDDVSSRVNFLIAVPHNKSDKDDAGRADDLKAIVGPMETIFSNLTAVDEVIGHRHLTFEIATDENLITFFATVPSELADFLEKQITSQYSDALVEKVPYPNIFVKGGAVHGVQMGLKKGEAWPLRTYARLQTDGLAALTNALSKLTDIEAGAAIQIAFRPTHKKWGSRARQLTKAIQQGKDNHSIGQGVLHSIGGLLRREDSEKEADRRVITSGQEEVIKAIDEKSAKPGFEVVIRVVASAADMGQAKGHVKSITDSFLQFNSPELNSLEVKKTPAKSVIRDYILRQFGSGVAPSILNTEELASIFHFPGENIDTPSIRWMKARRIPAPEDLPREGIELGKNIYRGTEKTVRISRDDRRRHVYVIGKTGTGKSSWMQNLAYQDIMNGDGVCFIDPHGDAVEWLLQRIPRNRVDDVVHFYPPDTERPMGLNLLEAKTPAEKDMVVSEMISIFYKLFDPNSSGIVGPIFEHYMRNAMLLLLADQEEGATLIDIPRVFTDKMFRERKLLHVTDPTVLRFWKEEFAQAEKSNQAGELFSYIVSKIGRFISNEMMRNIVGQTKSSFNIRDVMDNKKILLVNLAKGLTGEINSNLLGFVLVSKMQMAALSRADNPNADYPDFYLYIDEFQNVTTDSIATILSEARKYRLNLTVAHQFMAQLEEKIRDAVLGNVGSMVSFRIGAPDAEMMVKEFAPDVSENDLVNVENFNAYVKLMINGTASKPFTLKSLPPLGEKNPRISQAIAQLSRLKFGKDRRIVELQVGERIKFAKGSGLPGLDEGI